MGNNVTRRVGNYVLTSGPQLGNYVIADMPFDLREKSIIPTSSLDAQPS